MDIWIHWPTVMYCVHFDAWSLIVRTCMYVCTYIRLRLGYLIYVHWYVHTYVPSSHVGQARHDRILPRYSTSNYPYFFYYKVHAYAMDVRAMLFRPWNGHRGRVLKSY